MQTTFRMTVMAAALGMLGGLATAQEQGATEVALWGSGEPTREFLYVDDAAEGIVSALEQLEGPDPVNLGSAAEISIRDLADQIALITGYEGSFIWDRSNPDGQPRRSVDASKARTLMGWAPKVGLDEGLRATIDWYRQDALGSSGRLA